MTRARTALIGRRLPPVGARVNFSEFAPEGAGRERLLAPNNRGEPSCSAVSTAGLGATHFLNHADEERIIALLLQDAEDAATLLVAKGESVRYGEQQIESARLEAVPNPKPERDYRIDCTCPEFTTLCPRSGFPDFATIRISYVPDQSIVELKSLKLYLNRYRNEYTFHEAAVNTILDDLVVAIQPRWMQVVGDFGVRGNIKTVITATHTKEGYHPTA